MMQQLLYETDYYCCRYYPNKYSYKPKARGSTTVFVGQAVSQSNSSVIFTPSKTSWGYGNYVVVRATIKDTNNNPLPNVNVLYVRLYNQSGTVLYNDSTIKTTTSTGEVQYSIPIDNINSAYIPVNAIVEVGVASGSTVVALRASTTLGITGKATTVTVTTDKTNYAYNETITLTINMTDSANNTTVGAPVYVRILQGTNVIKDFGRVYSSLDVANRTYTIQVNTTNFPSTGQYTIEVADNANYSAAAILTQQIDVNAIMMLMISVMLISAVFNMISSFKSSFSLSPRSRSK